MAYQKMLKNTIFVLNTLCQLVIKQPSGFRESDKK